MKTHAMSPADAAWYHMDGPENLAMVTGVLLTSQVLDFADQSSSSGCSPLSACLPGRRIRASSAA